MRRAIVISMWLKNTLNRFKYTSIRDHISPGTVTAVHTGLYGSDTSKLNPTKHESAFKF